MRFHRARGRHQPGVMNKLEAMYAIHLEQLKYNGLVLWFAFESIKFKLADKTYYTPDFMVMDKAGLIEVHEVKGFWEDDARVKIKVAASKFSLFKFVAIKLDKREGWVGEEISGNP